VEDLDILLFFAEAIDYAVDVGLLAVEQMP
jgi:hypothetical protein